MKGTVIYPDGRREPITLTEENKLREIYAVIGCTVVEHVTLKGGGCMWFDGEGTFHVDTLPTAERVAISNDEATLLLLDATGVPWDCVTGVVVVEAR
jgi:hypothetical protein